MRDYGTAEWVGGDAECDHAAKPIPHTGLAVARDRIRGTEYKDGPRGEAGTREAKQPRVYRHTCPKCGARRIDKQLGLEPTPEEYVAKMVDVFREVYRVLRDDGVVWLNLGDSYTVGGYVGDSCPSNAAGSLSSKHKGQRSTENIQRKKPPPGLKFKDLCGIPWRVAFALQADGWYLRSDIIWSKPNPMPESCTDRPTKSHEYLFLLTKRPRYYYDAEAVREEGSEPAGKIVVRRTDLDEQLPNPRGIGRNAGQTYVYSGYRNKRSVWTINSEPYADAHFATFPSALVEPCILAGTSERGCCVGCGKGWVRVVEKGARLDAAPSDLDRYGTGKAGVHRKVGRAYQDWKSSHPDATLGWRPDCKCYGLKLIDDQLPKPSQRKDEPDDEWRERLAEWEVCIARWRRLWAKLKPRYDAQTTAPAVVLDPFIGSGTTAAVAVKHGRRCVGIDLSAEYLGLIRRRVGRAMRHADLDLFRSMKLGLL